MSRQATLFHSWGSGSQKKGSQHAGAVKVGRLKTADALENDELDDEDLLLAIAMEESLKDLPQPDVGPSASSDVPRVCSALSDSKKEALMKKQSLLFKSVTSSETARSTDQCDNKQNNALGPDDTLADLPDISNVEELPGFDTYAGRMWIYPTNLPVREYQFSIVKEALFKNTLVVLPTGLGKTFIAAVIMYNYYRWYPQGKVIFMAPTKPLVAQQIEACYNIMGIPQEDTAEMTGAMQPNERQKIWRERRVFFLTPQVLTNDLSRNTCPAERVKCLVVDEAHKALGNHAYCQVVRELVKYSSNFRVLALSATPGTDIKAVQQVLNNLLIAHVELRSEDSKDLQQYTYERKVEKIVVPLDDELKSVQEKYLQILDAVVSRLKRQGVLYNRETKSMSKFLILKARDAFRQNPPVNLQHQHFGVIEGDFALCMSLYHGYELLQLHGLRSLYNFLEGIMNGEKAYGRTRSELQKNVAFCELLKSLRDKFDHVRCLDPNVSFRSQSAPTEQKPVALGHPKMKCLETVVLEHFNKYQQDLSTSSGPSTRIMIFSQYRDSVNEISEMLHRHRPLVKVMSFVGQSSVGKSSRGFTQKEQLMVMKKFREGGYNTLVSTCVGEEGLDIGDVDLIICFDAHKSPIRLVQRMGRTGRKRKGRIVMLVTEGKEEQIYNQSQYNKKSIHKAILNGAKSLVYYPNNPAMVPKGLTPVCHKMHLTVQTDYKAQSKGKDRSLQRNKLQTLGKSVLSKRTGTIRAAADGLLTEADMEYWATHYRLPSSETPFLPESEFLTLPPHKNKPVNQEGIELSLSDWMPWQNRLQTTVMSGHSDVTRLLVDVIEFMDLLSAVGTDEDTYGQEMALYLNEDDILKPGESNEDHGILKFCNRAKPGVSEDMSKAGVKSIAGKSKHRSSVLPQLHDDPVLVGSDDEELPVIGARVEHSHVFADDKRTEDKPNEVTDDKSTHKTSGNKLNAFTFIETSGEDQSKTDQQKSIIDLNINKQKNSLRQSEIQTDPFSTVHNAAALDDEDDDDFQDAAIIVKERESLDGKTKSMSGPLGKEQTHCHSSAVAELAASAVCSSGSDDDKQNVVLKRNGLKSVVDEEELRLLELLPLSSSPEKGIDYLSETETDRITSPPCLDEMHLVFEQLDKKGHISPVNVLDMVDKWERPASAVCNNEISNLKNSRVWCEHDQNDCEMSVPFLPLEQPILSSQKDREMKLTGESLTRMCDRSISPRTERPLTEQRISEENKKQKNDSEIQAVVKKPPDGSLNVCDEAGKQPTHGALDGTLVHPDLQRTPAKKRMHDYNSTDVKQISDNLVDTQDANTNLMLHRFGETSLDMNDFCEPFTMEATSSKHTDVMFEHPAAEVVSYRKSPLPVAAVTRECTSTPVPDQGNDRLLSKTNKLYDEGDLFEDDDDDMFVDVSCNIPESKPTMSNAIGDKSQLTFTQALHCLDVTMDSSGKDCQVKKNSDGSHLPEVTSVDRNASSYLKDETDKIKVESNIMQTEKISQSNNSSQVNEPQFDLGFDLDFDLDEFEDEIVPPSPEHVTRPARLRHLDKSTFWTGNQTDLATSVNSVPQSAALVPALAAEVKSSSSINREVKPSFKLLHRPVAVVAPSGDAVVAPQETKQPEDGRRNEKQSSTLTFATPIRKLDEPISKDDLSDEADESLIKVSSRRPRANVLASPDTQRDVVSEPTEQNPFKTPMKPALRSHKSMKFHKRLRVSSGDDDDDDNDDGNSNNDESPIIRPKPRKTLRVNSILVDDDNDDFTEAGMPRIEKSRKKPALSAKNRIPLKKSKYSSRPLSNFIEHEAEVSGSEGSVSSDESDGSDLDQFDASFINDMSQMSQVCGSVDMKAVYLQSVRSPACRGQYKIAYGKGADVDVYSQIPEDESEYMEDSFCVANDFEEKEVNDTAVETSVLGSRAAKLQGAQKLKFAELRTRRMLKKKSTDGNFNNKETCGRVSENWMVGRNHKCNKQTVESSSEDELVKQKYDYQGDKRENAQLEGDLSGVAPGPQAHHSVSSDDCSPPLLSLKSRIRRKLAPLDRTESGHSSHGVMSRTKTQEHNQFRSNPMRTDRMETKVTKPLETPLFSLGLADLDLDLDDDGLEEIGTELQSDKDASCRLVQNDLANEETVKQSGVMSFSLAGNDVNRVSSFGVFINPEVTSTNVSPPSVQSRQERLRLSRLKQEEFRKKFTHQKTCGNESNQSHESGISDISVGEFDKSKIDLCPVINKNNSQISIDNNDQFNKTSFTNIKEKLVVLVDSREITAAQNLVSTLRFNHNLHISVKSLGNCDYIVSNRMAIERKTVSDFTNGANKKKLLDRLRLLCELFDRPCLIVEKDRVRPGQKEPTKPLLCSRYVQHVVSCLAQTHIKLLYSDNDQETASLIAALCLQEQKKNMAITCNVELSQSQEQVLNFYLSFPKVNYALALKLLNSFTSISEFIKSSVIVLEKKLAVSQQKAKELYLYVRHRFNPELAKTNTTTAMPSANR